MRAEKYDPRYIEKPSRRHVYRDFWDWLNQHPLWILLLVIAPLVYLVTTEEV